MIHFREFGERRRGLCSSWSRCAGSELFELPPSVHSIRSCGGRLVLEVLALPAFRLRLGTDCEYEERNFPCVPDPSGLAAWRPSRDFGRPHVCAAAASDLGGPREIRHKRIPSSIGSILDRAHKPSVRKKAPEGGAKSKGPPGPGQAARLSGSIFLRARRSMRSSCQRSQLVWRFIHI